MSVNLTHLVFIYSAFFICAVVFSVLINGLFLKFVRTLGIRNPNDGTIIRWGSLSKPALGGISFYIIFLFSIAGYTFMINSDLIANNTQFLGLLMSTTVGFLIGLADDAYNTNPLLKFLAQIMCGLILISTGTYIHLFVSEYINYIFTVLWVVGIMNSVNMLDNMDGITALISISIILSVLSILCIKHNFTSINFIISLGVVASLVGFLFYNWHPSKIYMGDTGSQFLGIFLAAIGIIYFWNDTLIDNFSMKFNLRKIIIPMLVFIMPIVDTTIVVIYRIGQGRSPFIGGKDHTTHRLAYLGFSDRQVAIVFFVISIISSALVIVMHSYIADWSYLTSVLFVSYFLIILGVFLYISKITDKDVLISNPGIEKAVTGTQVKV